MYKQIFTSQKSGHYLWIHIISQKLPVPHRDMLPISLEEQVVCFADKFYSKTHLEREKTVEKARKSLSNFGNEGLKRFDRWCEQFL